MRYLIVGCVIVWTLLALSAHADDVCFYKEVLPFMNSEYCFSDLDASLPYISNGSSNTSEWLGTDVHRYEFYNIPMVLSVIMTSNGEAFILVDKYLFQLVTNPFVME